MKKLSFFFIALLFAMSAQAQSISFGPRVGLNFSKLATDQAEAKDMFKGYTSFVAGGFVNVKFNKLAIQPELQYSQQGSKIDAAALLEGMDLDGVKANLKNAYLNLPIMVKFYPIAGLNIQAGPQFGFLLSSKMDVEMDGTSVTEDFKENLKSQNYSINLGAGYDTPFGLTIDVRYNLGLNDLNKVQEAGAGYLKDRTVQIGLGYAF